MYIIKEKRRDSLLACLLPPTAPLSRLTPAGPIHHKLRHRPATTLQQVTDHSHWLWCLSGRGKPQAISPWWFSRMIQGCRRRPVEKALFVVVHFLPASASRRVNAYSWSVAWALATRQEWSLFPGSQCVAQLLALAVCSDCLWKLVTSTDSWARIQFDK